MFVLACALLAGISAFALARFMRRNATTEAPILRGWLHVAVATVLGGLAGLASSWAKMLAFVVLAVAAGLLTVIDLAEERLPDAIVLPLLGLTPALLTLAAWTTGQWDSLGRAVLAGVASIWGRRQSALPALATVCAISVTP